MWTALGQHATVLFVIASLFVLAVTEFVLVANGVLRIPAAHLAERDPYLWSRYIADVDPYVWAAYVVSEYVPAPTSENDDTWRRHTERAAS